MFKKNEKHLSPELFGMFNSLPETLQIKAKQSKEYAFYKMIFCNIDEEIFSVLYSKEKSRPNSPVNSLVSALVMMSHRKWSYEELFSQINFNILIKLSLGLDRLEEQPFSMATLFNFQNRLHKHFCETGENLLETVFDKLTSEQLKVLKIKTDIQRTDSFAASSNIGNYSRLQLLVELILRIWRLLSPQDKIKFKEKFSCYIKHKSSGQFIYSLKNKDIPKELDKLGELYQWINNNLRNKYRQDIFNVFDRLYDEHFTIVSDKIEIKSNEQMHSSCLQSVDDLDAAYRKKNKVQTKGQTINLVETANPQNKINLITDISVKPVNVNDDVIINERINIIKEKTPELKELHSDAAYGSSSNDREFKKNNINHIQTAVKGNKSQVEIIVKKDEVSNKEMADKEVSDNNDCERYSVSCPHQTVKSEKTLKRFKACFDLSICSTCSLSSKCQTQKMKKHRVYYFTEDTYLLSQRLSRLRKIPKERRFLRNNVEATVKEFTCRMPNKKLKVRGAFKATLFAFSTAIAINYGRIYRMMASDKGKWSIFAKPLLTYLKKLKNLLNGFSITTKSKYKANYGRFFQILITKLLPAF